MNWVLLILFSVAIAEALIRLPIVRLASQIASLSRRSIGTLRATRVSDHWKEKAMGEFSLRTFKSTLGLCASFFALATVAVVLALLAEQVHAGFTEFLISGPAIVASTLIAIAFVIFRAKWMKPFE